MFKVGIIGCGAIAQTHISFLKEFNSVKIVALCDILTERAEQKKVNHNLKCKIFDDYKKMLSECNLDVIHICTPHYLHSEMAIEALKRNINVILEKPVAITLKQANDLLEAAKTSNAKICVSFQNRYLLRNKTVKELIDSGKAGKVIHVNGNVSWHRVNEYYTNSHWRGFKATEGGGVLINQAIHTLDLIHWFCGEVDNVNATCNNFHFKNVIDVEDTVSACINFKNGAKCLFNATNGNYKDEPVNIKIVCENMLLELKDNDLYIDNVKQNLVDSVLGYTGKDYWGVGHYMLFKSFYENLETKSEINIDVFEATKVLKSLLAIYDSQGKTIKL